MAILKIARMGHPVLARVADAIADATAPGVAGLAADMIDTLADVGGVGLAAPQVHVSARMVVFHVPEARNDGNAVALTVLINPEITPLDGETEEAWEACLSLPGLTGRVARHVRIRYRGLGLNGEAIEREAAGFHARVVQHECDHLDGVLYPNRLRDLAAFGFADEIHRYRDTAQP